jgi:hypothetical protein
MNLVTLGSWVAIIAFSAISLFQIALIAGAPWGEYAVGGAHKGKLPVSFRVGSAFTLALYAGIVGHYLAQAGVLTKFLDAGLNGIANWALVVLNVFSLLANSLTQSQKEKTVWAPVAFVILLASLLVAIG